MSVTSEHDEPLVRALDLRIRWAPNVPSPVFFSGDTGKAELWLLPHFDDEDQSWVVLRWVDFCAARLMPHNDEARHSHVLYRYGLSEVRWIGEAVKTEWLTEVSAAVFLGSRPPIRHFLVLLKENMVEVAASRVEVHREPDPPANGWMHMRLS